MEGSSKKGKSKMKESTKKRKGVQEDLSATDSSNIITTKLMEHQEKALEWLLNRESSRDSPPFWTGPRPLRGGVFNDDAGLGKTLTMLCLMTLDEKESMRTKPTLVVCPTDLTIDQWSTQVKEHGLDKKLKLKTFKYDNFSTRKEVLRSFDLVLTTIFELGDAIKQRTALAKLAWRRIILDEAHRIEKIDNQQMQALMAVKSKRKWAFTGKAIKNEHYDLHSILTFLGFKESSLLSIRYENLMDIINAISFRRTRDMLGLPRVIKQIHYVEFSPKEREVYDEVKEEVNAQLTNFDKNNDKDALIQIQISFGRLLNICTDLALDIADTTYHAMDFPDASMKPDLLQTLLTYKDSICPFCSSSPRNVLISHCCHIFCRDCILKWFDEDKNSCPVCRKPLSVSDLFSTSSESSTETEPSTKVSCIMKLLKKSQEEHPSAKSVVFSQKDMPTILKKNLREAGFKTLHLKNNSKKSRIIEKFQAKDGPVVMVVGITAIFDKINFAGANLTAASTVYIMEPFFSPVIEEQVIQLVHGIGQKKIVKVINLIVKNSIETKILELKEKKRENPREAFEVEGHIVGIHDMRFLMEREQ